VHLLSGSINNSLIGVDESVDVETHYFRIAAVDAAGNVGDVSNPVAATFVTEIDIEVHIANNK